MSQRMAETTTACNAVPSSVALIENQQISDDVTGRPEKVETTPPTSQEYVTVIVYYTAALGL